MANPAFNMSSVLGGLEVLAQERPSLTWLEQLTANSETVTIVLAFAFLTAIILVPVLARYWYLVQVRQWESSLKQSMVERGMSAEEIKAVLDAGHGK